VEHSGCSRGNAAVREQCDAVNTLRTSSCDAVDAKGQVDRRVRRQPNQPACGPAATLVVRPVAGFIAGKVSGEEDATVFQDQSLCRNGRCLAPKRQVQVATRCKRLIRLAVREQPRNSNRTFLPRSAILRLAEHEDSSVGQCNEGRAVDLAWNLDLTVLTESNVQVANARVRRPARTESHEQRSDDRQVASEARAFHRSVHQKPR
jgi:hypothetical protein